MATTPISRRANLIRRCTDALLQHSLTMPLRPSGATADRLNDQMRRLIRAELRRRAAIYARGGR